MFKICLSFEKKNIDIYITRKEADEVTSPNISFGFWN